STSSTCAKRSWWRTSSTSHRSSTGRRPASFGWIPLALDRAQSLFSDRTGGVSAPPFDTANAGYSRGDDPANVDENRVRIGAELGGPGSGPGDWVSPHPI